MIERLRLDAVPPPPLRGHLPLGDDRLVVTSRYLERDGRPVLPVSAELHYSRMPAHTWDDELRKVRAAGVTVAATYAIWIHHEQVEGELRFDGALDLRRFVELCGRHGLDVFLRIGPWAHAEARNGGLPDWLLGRELVPRSDDPAYLAEARRWFRALAAQLDGLALFAVQVENELYDDPEHLRTLATLARSAGIHAPLWTGTAWGGAQLPVDELLPLYAGYSEAFWIAHDAGFDAASAGNFYYSDERDEVGVGADTRDSALRPSNLDPSRYPYATCELGGGMVAAYHRRPHAAPDDVAALALTKLGSGSSWQGYYMFHDGLNPARGLQETHATGAANDLPELSYDFNAPLGVNGEVRESLRLLRLQHLALARFGDRLAPLPMALPDRVPSPGDVETLRWAVRTDGDTGFVFVTNHQPGVTMPRHDDVVLAVDVPAGTVRFPAVTVPPGAYFWWPFRFRWHGVRIAWATAQLVTEVSWRGAPLLVLAATDGIPVRLAVEHAGGEQEVTGPLTPSREPVLDLVADGTTVGRVLVLTAADARRLHVAADTVVLSDAMVAGDVVYAQESEPEVAVLTDDGFTTVRLPAGAPLPATVPVTVLRADGVPAPIRIGPRGRASAPVETDYAGAARYRLDLSELPTPSDDLEVILAIDWAGDVSRVLADGELVADCYYTGRPWTVAARMLHGAVEVVVEILPLRPDAPVHLPQWARPAGAEPVGELRAIAVERVERRSLPAP